MSLAAATSTASRSRWRCEAASTLKQQQLRQRRRRLMQTRHALRSPAEKQKQMPADPLLRLAGVTKLPLVGGKAPIVARAQDAGEGFVVADPLDEKGRNLRRSQPPMN